MKFLLVYLSVLVGSLGATVLVSENIAAKPVWCWPRDWRVFARVKPRLSGNEFVPYGSYGSEIDWNNPPGGWVFYSFAPDNDLTETVLLGNVPFANADAEWAPPCFNPPDIIDNCYKVHFRGTLRRATKEETSDMAQCITLTPSKLQAFLLEKLHKGELRTVKDI